MGSGALILFQCLSNYRSVKMLQIYNKLTELLSKIDYSYEIAFIVSDQLKDTLKIEIRVDYNDRNYRFEKFIHKIEIENDRFFEILENELVRGINERFEKMYEEYKNETI